MKFNLTESELKIDIIKTSLIEQFGETEFKNFSGQPSKQLGEVLNNLAEQYGDTITLQAFKEALNLQEEATMPFSAEDKVELKKAIDQGGSPDAVVALVKTKAMEKDPEKKAALAKLNEDLDESIEDVIAILAPQFDEIYDVEEANNLINQILSKYPEYSQLDTEKVLFAILESLNKAICSWCGVIDDKDSLVETDMGLLCDRCVAAILSRGEELWIKA